MAEWLIEEGIGETRAIRLESGAIAEARLAWPGELAAGAVLEARLASRPRASTRGTAQLAAGAMVLLDRLPPGPSEGATIRVEITRPAMAEHGRRKRARGRLTDAPLRPVPFLADALVAGGHAVRRVRRFPDGDWDGLIAEAFAAEIAFSGGTALFSPTPAMTLVDIDGALDPRALALAACRPIAQALGRFDIGGSVGIDFPGLADKPDRRAVDEMLGGALAGRPHERTAMNGFGFVQLVMRLERPSLLHRAALSPAATATRLLLRRAEMLEGPGLADMAGHPSLQAHLRPEWLDELTRRTGRPHRFRADPALAVEAPQAQLAGR